MEVTSGIWEGERSSEGLVRVAIQRMDEKFVQAMAEAHADRTTPVRSTATVRAKLKASGRVVTASSSLSLHDVDGLQLADEEVAKMRAVLNQPSVNRIVTAVASRTGVSPYKIAGRGRSVDVVRARNWAFFLLSEDGFSLAQIGRMFGKDHTTVRHGIIQHKKGGGE